ncbi:MAG: hypothetical protein QFE16_16380 [Pseudomonadota bacterium]|nr:hypothetical protein [Pseudomonadota bacterium]
MMLNDQPAQPTTKGKTVLLLATMVVALIGGCANLNSASPEDTVRERAKQRWIALLSGDTRKAYEFTTPSFRSVSGFDAYKAKFGSTVNLLAAEVVSVTCEAEKCATVVRVDARPLLGAHFGNTISTHVDETWLLEDGRWWFFQKL